MKLSLIQMNSAGDRDENVRKAISMIADAARQEPDLVVLPEFFNTYYFAEDFDRDRYALAEPADGPSMTAIVEAARSFQVHIAATIYELAFPGVYFDTTFLVAPTGRQHVLYRKTHPAAVLSVEKLYFQPGSSFGTAEIAGMTVGCVTCYDSYFPESVRCAALNGAEVVIVPFAAPEADHTLPDIWTSLMRVRALENGVFLAPCNKVGKEKTWTFCGGTMIVAPDGRVIQEPQAGEGVISAWLDREDVLAARRRLPVFRDRRPDLYRPIVAYADELPKSVRLSQRQQERALQEAFS